jgi:ubiquitin C-terminal hydrolase
MDVYTLVGVAYGIGLLRSPITCCTFTCHSFQNMGVLAKQTFLKKLSLGRAPSCLCIHFNRTLWSSDGFLHKNDLHISFPTSLDASKLLKDEGNGVQLQYLLYAVVQHIGGPNSGHYFTYRRCAAGNKWVCASDTVVYSASVSEVLRAEAYMLFYCRTNSSAH